MTVCRLIYLIFVMIFFNCNGNPVSAGLVSPYKIAFVSASVETLSTDVFVMNADGTEKTQLTYGLNDRATHISCSPDGRRIAIAARRPGGAFDIYVMNSDGSDLVKIGDNLLRGGGISWSPDCSKLAFTSDKDGNREIYSMNTDGTGLTRLTYNEIQDDMAPQWSPDGLSIVYTSGPRIYLMNSDGSDKRLLAAHIDYSGGPQWSPNGSRIAYQMGGEIYVMFSNGSGQVNLTNNNYPDFSHSWSPDGTKIVFVSYREGNHDIYIMNANGTGERMITDRGANYDTPAWSPDGSKIVFIDKYDKTGLGYSPDDIYIINSDGSGMKNITNDTSFNNRPSWLKSSIY